MTRALLASRSALPWGPATPDRATAPPRAVTEERRGGAVRTIVLPALRLLVWAVIAVALRVLALGRGGDRPAGADALKPTGGVTAPTVAAATGDVTSDLRLTGTVHDHPAPARAGYRPRSSFVNALR